VIACALRSASSSAKLGWIFVAIGTVLGVSLTFTGATRPLAPLLYGHIFVCAAGVLFLLAGYGRNRLPMLRLAATLLVAFVVGGSAWAAREVSWHNGNRITNPAMPPESQDFEGQGVKGDFFPSSVRTSTGGKLEANFFMESGACQRCHADIFSGNSSAHHFSSFNNQCTKSRVMQDVIGVKPRNGAPPSRSALLFSGKSIAGAKSKHAGRLVGWAVMPFCFVRP
jgi:hypothetical protein